LARSRPSLVCRQGPRLPQTRQRLPPRHTAVLHTPYGQLHAVSSTRVGIIAGAGLTFIPTGLVAAHHNGPAPCALRLEVHIDRGLGRNNFPPSFLAPLQLRLSSGALVSAHELLTSAPPYVPLLRTQPLAFEHLNRTRRAVVTGVQPAHLRQHPLRFNSAAAVPHLPRPVVSDASDIRAKGIDEAAQLPSHSNRPLV
jgi:hypothetical protein